MPNASGQITTSDVRSMKAMAGLGMSQRAIAEALGCGQTSVWKHLNGVTSGRRDAAPRYHRFVALASAYVPTFGGGR